MARAKRSKSKRSELEGQPDPRAALDSAGLLSACQGVLARLEADLLERTKASPAVTRALEEKLENLSFVLGARPWRAVAIDFAQGIVRVEPIASGKLARWQGRSSLLGRELCQAMREIIVSDDAAPEWSRRARDKLAELRAEYRDAGAGSSAIVSDMYGLRLWTFGGGKANNLLAQCLEERLGDKVVVDNLYVAFRGQAAASEAAIREAIAELRREGRPNDLDALRLAEHCARGRLSKFQRCLPPRLESAFLAEVLTDPAAARAAIASESPD